MNKNRSKPDFIIIGAAKCATTTLHNQLGVQSGFFMSDPKEPNFFSNDDNYKNGFQTYLALFNGATLSDLCGESSTHYTNLPTYPQTVNRIKTHVPDAKFIYVMRHPIERLVSDYVHEWSERKVNNDINEAVRTFPPLIQYSLYSLQIRPYLETFGSEQILALFSENLRHHPQRELERICQFLGYSGQPTWCEDLNQLHISSKRLRNSVWRDTLVNQPVLRYLRQTFVPKGLRTWVRGFWQMKKRPQLREETVMYLEEIFDRDLAFLGQWLGINLTCRIFKSAVGNAPDRFIHWQTTQ